MISSIFLYDNCPNSGRDDNGTKSASESPTLWVEEQHCHTDRETTTLSKAPTMTLTEEFNCSPSGLASNQTDVKASVLSAFAIVSKQMRSRVKTMPAVAPARTAGVGMGVHAPRRNAGNACHNIPASKIGKN